MTAERVVVTRTEIRQVRDLAAAILTAAEAILKRPEPRPADAGKGWPSLSSEGDQS